MNLIDRLKHARRVSVPLVAITTPDPAATLAEIAKAVNGDTPIVGWDVARGSWPVNTAGEEVDRQLGGEAVAGNPMAVLSVAAKAPSRTMLAILQADAWLDDPATRQAVWNLRDAYKTDHRMLLLLAHDLTLPPNLKDDVVLLDEPLPDEEQLRQVVKQQDQAAGVCPKCGGAKVVTGLSCETCKGTGRSNRKDLTVAELQGAVEAVAGLAAFPAEQAVAMALRPKGIDLDHLWATKRALVQQTRGLSVYRGGEKFADLGGLAEIKDYLTGLMTGRNPPRVIVWLDEVEKSGLAHSQDLSGVNADQLGTMLSYMEDHGVYGVMLVGVAGSGKSAICKSAGATFGRLVVRIDMGALQGSFVGESQASIRAALKVISGIGGDNALWLATSNSVEGLDTALRSRFSDTFFFDLPDEDERKPIWRIWLGKYPEVEQETVDDAGWVGRNIRQCVEKAWRMNRSLASVAERIIPQEMMEREAIARMRAQADGRYLSASRPGVYRAPREGKRQRAVTMVE